MIDTCGFRPYKDVALGSILCSTPEYAMERRAAACSFHRLRALCSVRVGRVKETRRAGEVRTFTSYFTKEDTQAQERVIKAREDHRSR